MVKELSTTKSLNISVASLCKGNQLEKAETVIEDAIKLGVLPDLVTYNTLIFAYGRLVGFDAASSIFSRMKTTGIEADVVTYTTLMAVATRRNCFLQTTALFDEMLKRNIRPNVWTYNTLMHCYFKSGNQDEAYRLFKSITNPCPTTMNIMIDGLCNSGCATDALILFINLKRRGHVPELSTFNVLINGLCKSGWLGSVRRILMELKESGNKPNAATYTTLMKFCFKSRRYRQGLNIFYKMRDLGYTVDSFVYCTVIGALVRIGKTNKASKYAEEMLRNGVKLDLVCYNTLINLALKEGKFDHADKLLDEANKAGFAPDKYTKAIIMDGAQDLGDDDDLKHQYKSINNLDDGMMGQLDSNIVSFNIKLNAMLRKGDLNGAMRTFNSSDIRDSYTYSSFVNHLCKMKRYGTACKLIHACIRSGGKIHKSSERAVLTGLRSFGFTNEAEKIKKAIQLAKKLLGEGQRKKILSVQESKG